MIVSKSIGPFEITHISLFSVLGEWNVMKSGSWQNKNSLNVTTFIIFNFSNNFNTIPMKYIYITYLKIIRSISSTVDTMVDHISSKKHN